MADSAGPLQLKGTERVEVWKKLLDRAGGEIRARDGKLERKRNAVRTSRKVAIAIALVAGGVLWFWISYFGVLLGVAAAIAAFVLLKPPKPDFIGPERVDFVDVLLRELAAIAPKSRITLAAQLDARRAVPKAELPAGSDNARVERESNEAWLSGSLAAIPGLRLSWQAREWRTVRLLRRKVVRRRTKIKTKAKFSIAKRLSVRLDADRALFAVKQVPVQKGRAEDGTVEVRESARGWSIRGRRDAVYKTALASADLAEELASLREKGQGEYFGDRPSALVSLMKLCEGRLLPAAAKGGAQ